jgi:prepilin-type N-terminal cleavage/methylation domain-containing protein
MKFLKSKLAFTLIELLVVITIIGILASIALPVFNTVTAKAHQTQALSNAKQVALALRLYSSDFSGQYPSYILANGQPTTQTVSDSNTAFAQLFPTYLQSEKIFQVPGSQFSLNPPDNIYDNPAPQDSNYTNTLKAGENGWAYVLQLTDTSNPSWPMIADGFSSAAAHTYTTDPSLKGGVWNGQKAVVICADSSGQVLTVDSTSYFVKGPNGSGVQGDIFTTSNSSNGWLGTGNAVVNPK